MKINVRDDGVEDLRRKIKDLKQENMELKDRVRILEESRANVLDTCRNTQKEQKDKIKELENAGFQMRAVHNSIMKYLAHKSRGKLKIPKDHMKITEKWTYEVEVKGDNYIYKLKEGSK